MKRAFASFPSVAVAKAAFRTDPHCADHGQRLGPAGTGRSGHRELGYSRGRQGDTGRAVWLGPNGDCGPSRPGAPGTTGGRGRRPTRTCRRWREDAWKAQPPVQLGPLAAGKGLGSSRAVIATWDRRAAAAISSQVLGSDTTFSDSSEVVPRQGDLRRTGVCVVANRKLNDSARRPGPFPTHLGATRHVPRRATRRASATTRGRLPGRSRTRVTQAPWRRPRWSFDTLERRAGPAHRPLGGTATPSRLTGSPRHRQGEHRCRGGAPRCAPAKPCLRRRVAAQRLASARVGDCSAALAVGARRSVPRT